ncbi:MAG: hypothetical protein HY820_30410 [Acidobacteria bacterium]|nr:hypothetical protein [Acidobacteriota bacterium]
MSSTSKKALIQRFDRENIYGYLNLASYLQPTGVELLNQSGNLLLVPYTEIKMVCFVREFEAPDPAEKRLFATRPKSPGLWVRLRFKDNDQMDGLLANDLLRQDAFGFAFTPPDPGSNSQRVFVPKQALSGVQVLSVVGSQPRYGRKPKGTPKDQMGLFETS